jgi:hypothetical protein
MTPQKKSLVKSSGIKKAISASAATSMKTAKLEGSKQVNLRGRK